MSLPQAEVALKAHLGNRFIEFDWQPALSAIMGAEGDTDKALSLVNNLTKVQLTDQVSKSEFLHSQQFLQSPLKPKL
jgi:hypothetical protein